MKLDITKLKEGDRFWFGDTEYEYIQPSNDIFAKMPHYLVKDIAWTKELDNSRPKSAKEEMFHYFARNAHFVAFPASQEIFSTKEEAIQAYIKSLEKLIEIHRENYRKVKKELDNLVFEKEYLEGQINKLTELEGQESNKQINCGIR